MYLTHAQIMFQEPTFHDYRLKVDFENSNGEVPLSPEPTLAGSGQPLPSSDLTDVTTWHL